MKLFISLFSGRPSYLGPFAEEWIKKYRKRGFSQHSLSNLQIPPFPIAYFNYTKVDWWKPPRQSDLITLLVRILCNLGNSPKHKQHLFAIGRLLALSNTGIVELFLEQLSRSGVL